MISAFVLAAGIALLGDDPFAAGAKAADALRLDAEVTARELEAHVRHLASDALLGRVTGTPQADEAAAYLARILARAGCQPAGDDGTFLQRVPLRRMRFDATPEVTWSRATGAPAVLAVGVDFDAPAVALEARDLTVRVVRAAGDLPKSADAKVALFIDATRTERQRWLEEAGLGDGSGFGLLVTPGSKKPGRPRDPSSGTGGLRRARPDSAREPVERVLRVHGAALEKLRDGTLARLSIVTHAREELLASSNVVARVRASGDKAQGGVLVLSAHYDHIAHGDHAGDGGSDTIFNGADDDASGVAVVLELAAAFAKSPPLAHDVILLLATGEEVGLLGTEEYLDRPVVPLAETVANLNFEMLGRPDPKVGGAGAMWLTGPSETNLQAAFLAARLDVQPDPRPDQHFYERSDNYAFVRRGVVGQTFSTYNLHTDYHRVSDEADKVDYAHLVACARTALDAVRLVADGRVVPAWAKGREPKPRK